MKWNPRMSRWYYHRKRSRAIVVERAGGRCEGCREPESSWTPLQLCHAFGRRNVIGEPLASLPCFTFLLCAPCHDRLDDRDGQHDAAFRNKLRWQSIDRAREELHIVDKVDRDPLGAARFIERILSQTGELDRIKEEALTR